MSNATAAIEEADNIWASTLQSGLDPSSRMYELMILVFLSSSDAELALKESEGFLDELLKQGNAKSDCSACLVQMYGSLGVPKHGPKSS